MEQDHATWARPFKPLCTDLDPRATIAHEVRAHRRLEVVPRAHLPGVALHETRVHALNAERERERAGSLTGSKIVLRLQEVKNVSKLLSRSFQ